MDTSNDIEKLFLNLSDLSKKNNGEGFSNITFNFNQVKTNIFYKNKFESSNRAKPNLVQKVLTLIGLL